MVLLPLASWVVLAWVLPPALTRCPYTTNIIEKTNGIVRRTSARVTHYRNVAMAALGVRGIPRIPIGHRRQSIIHMVSENIRW